MKSNLICMLITIIAYLILMIVVGILASKKNKDTSDFYLGGRKLGPIVTAMSAEASDMSSYLLMGLPGLALLTGFADVGWTVIGLAIGTYLNWLFVAKRLRIYSQHNGSITIPDFFSNRYHDNKHFLMGISAIIILIFFVPYTASGFSACGKLFQTLFGMNYHAAMILSAVIIIAYTSIGGFLAASTTDLLQSIIMTESTDFGDAFFKAEEATKTKLPTSGCVLISVNDRDKAEVVDVARGFYQLGFEIMATGRTCDLIEQAGIPALKVCKLNEGRPNILDKITNDQIQLIVNTPRGKKGTTDDSYIRKAAIKNRIPYITTMAAAKATVEGIRSAKRDGKLPVQSLQEFHASIIDKQ